MDGLRVRMPLAFGIAILSACGGSKTADTGQTTTTQDAGAEASTDDGPSTTADAGGSEAAPPDDGPWPAAHYPMPQFTNLGGPVLAAPKFITVTFVGNPDRDALRTFADQLVADTSWWQAVTQGYGIGAPSNAGSVEIPDTVSGQSLDDSSQLKPLIVKLVSTGALPPPDANTVYVMYFPASTTITLTGYGTSCNAFGAYHDSVTIPLEGGAVQAAYAVIPNCPQPPATDQGMDVYTSDVTHELIEAVTDPEPQLKPGWYGFNDAWFRVPGVASGPGAGQGEVADVCGRYSPATDANGNYLVRSWVNTAAAASHNPCQPAPAGQIFYSLAVPTQTLVSSDGYIVIKKGTTKTVDAVFFSDAKLPSDAQLTVGARSHGGLNPAIGTGITASMSTASAHNGMHVTLTFQVDASAASKDYNVTARAALSSTDYHDWPFILHVP